MNQDKVSYSATGMQRATELIIDKKLMGDSVVGYPHTYDLKAAFDNQPSVSSTSLMLATYDEYKARLAAFIAYVEKIEEIPSGTIDSSRTYKLNLRECPIY